MRHIVYSATGVGEVVGIWGIAGGCTGGFVDGAGLTGGLGIYSGPVWPQPASRPATPIMSAREDFTIKITV
jgi:hypothetical protein